MGPTYGTSSLDPSARVTSRDAFLSACGMPLHPWILEVDRLLCPRCQGEMKIAVITESQVGDGYFGSVSRGES
jgi:hypothetical protein